MKRNIAIPLATALLSIALTTSLRAQGTTAFTYQGKLSVNGAPANGSHDIAFTLFAANTGGVAIAGPVTNTAVDVTNGLFTTTVDFGDAFTGSSNWLEIAVSTNGANAFNTLAPRQRLAPAPFAVSAENLSGTLPAVQVTGVLANGNMPASPTFSGTITANSYSGNGAGITNLNASQLASGVVSTNVLPNFQPPLYATVAGGENNVSSSSHTTVGGGYLNQATNIYATVAGGQHNSAGPESTVGGGNNNSAPADTATVAGGGYNTASGNRSTVGGGVANMATNEYATVPGGSANFAGGQYSFAAGRRAQAVNDGAFVWADSQNADFSSTANNSFNVRANGGVRFETAGARMTLDGQPVLTISSGALGLTLQQNIFGAPNVIEGSAVNFVSAGTIGATIGGGGESNDGFGHSETNSVNDDFGTVSGGLGNTANDYSTTVGGGQNNTASGSYATVGGGQDNTARGLVATVGGGLDNNASDDYAMVGGGGYNTASGGFSTVGGGNGNTASGIGATVGGGESNTAGGYGATVGGGAGNQATGSYGTVPGGYDNLASGAASFAAGQRARALHQGAFVWADSQNADFSSTTNDQFLIRAQGGVGINSSNPSGALSVNTGGGTITLRNDSGLTPGIDITGGYQGTLRLRSKIEVWPSDDATYAGRLDIRNTSGNATVSLAGQSGDITASGTITCTTLNQTSDRNAKENFAPVDDNSLLEKIAALPITEWNYKTDAATQKHIGPMAQDFHAAFGVNGSDDKHISVIDEGGVALAAIKGLNQKVETENTELKAQVTDLRSQLKSLQKVVARLAAKSAGSLTLNTRSQEAK